MMKVCLISFDYWDYDYHIVETLKQKGIDAKHIDISKFKYTYKTPFHKVLNFLSKVFLNKNIKKIKRLEFIKDTLKTYGKQDAILCIRPDLLNLDTHKAVKALTDKYIAYIYDSCERFPFNPELNTIFNKIYSFDLDDVEKYKFTHIPNYIYLNKKPIQTQFKYDMFMVMSVDDRLKTLNKMASYLDANNLNYKFIVVGKYKPKQLHPGIVYQKAEIRPEALQQYLDDSRVILDLIRTGHNGLSFRVFESLANQKKLITTNTTISKYAFYNPENIQIIQPENVAFSPRFFKTPYQPLEPDIYQQYTIENWVDTVFELKAKN
ncbi:hypothetical protein ACW5R3_10540 [Bizionia sp. KMM 8389]